MGYYIIREPKYFREFSCKGSECESNCCNDWESLVWLDDEYKRLCSLDLSKEMREKVESAFEELEIPEYNGVLHNLNLSGRKCPFLAENSLCSIQREFGEEFISNTCRIYPRISVFNSAIMTRGCSASCPETAKALLNDEYALEMCEKQVRVDGNEVVLSSVLCEGEEEFLLNPALRFRNEIFSAMYGILSNRKRTFAENLLSISELAARISDEPAKITAAANEKPNLTPNVGLDLEKSVELYANIFGSSGALSSILTDGKPDREKISNGAELFPTYFFGNLALNFLFELKMPFCFPNVSILENCKFFISVCVLAYLLISASALDGGTEFAVRKLTEFDTAVIHDRTAAEKILALAENLK